MGKAWTFPGELLLVHGASRYLRFRHVDKAEWSGPMERTGNECMALVDLDQASRREIWPGDGHRGLPVLLPGGEAGRLIKFTCSDDQHSWTYTLEFQGEHPPGVR